MPPEEISVDVGKGYMSTTESTVYLVAEKIVSRGFKLIYITKRNPDLLIEEFPWLRKEEGYWLTTSPTEKHKTLDPRRLEFEVTQTILEFVKNHKKSVVVVDAISLLMSRNDFDKLLEFVKAMADFVSLHDSVFLIYAPPKIFKEKERALLLEYVKLMKIGDYTHVGVKVFVRCAKCGKRVDESQTFCPSCGAFLTPNRIDNVEPNKVETLDSIIKEILEDVEKEPKEQKRVGVEPQKVEGKETKLEQRRTKNKEESFINGVRYQKRKEKTTKKNMIVGVFISVVLLIASLLIVWYALQPQTKIKVDGKIDDWQGITSYADTSVAVDPDINLNEYSVYYESDRVYFYAKVSGSLFNGANNGYDALIIFVDTDANANTGYRIENLGADAKIEVSGYAGEIRSAVASRFIEQSASSKPELNYSAWENAGEVRVEKSTNIVEGYAKIAGLKNPVSLVLMRHYESSAYAEKRGMALVSKTEGSLVVYQNFIGSDVVNADEDVLELRLVAKGKAVHVESLSVENANLDLPKKDLGVNEELTVRCKAKSLSDGNAYAFAVSSMDTNVPYRIVGNGGKAYFGSLPSGIVIDGAFGDWQGVQKGVDVPGDADKNIDLLEYASAITNNAYFYMAVDGTMLAGCEIPVLGARPPVQPGPSMPVVIKENLGMDVARVYIDLMNSTINTFNPAMISHGYLIELQGRNGQVISAKAWKWENGVKAEEIQNPNIAHGLSDGKIELSVGLDTLPGIDGNSKFYFEMSNWLGQKDASEIAYRAGKIWHENTAANGGTRVTPHVPIHINENSQFTPDNGVVGGSGTQSDPYIIEGWEIDANGGTYCIWIENTDVYFVIRNCNVYYATSTDTQPNGAGIALNNVKNGVLENNTASDNINGIFLSSSSNNTVTNTTASGNSWNGIYLWCSSNNTITDNTAFGNFDSGIYLYYSSNNTIINNTASSNTKYGIVLDYLSDSNTITNNTASNNDLGIFLGASIKNIITYNNASDNSIDGIRLSSSSNNNITNNNASDNYYGISLYSSSNNNITNNWICNNTYYGMNITSGSTSNTIHHNNFIGNNGAGKGVSGNCQAYDDVGSNYWYDNTALEGNYWSNWDGNGNGTANAYPINGGAGASDWYPLGSPVSELSIVQVSVLVICNFALLILRKKRKANFPKAFSPPLFFV